MSYNILGPRAAFHGDVNLNTFFNVQGPSDWVAIANQVYLERRNGEYRCWNHDKVPRLVSMHHLVVQGSKLEPGEEVQNFNLAPNASSVTFQLTVEFWFKVV
jgi:hypothetical protein